MVQTKISATNWELPGLSVAVTSDTKNFSVQKTEDAIDLIYTGITGVKLGIKTSR